MVETNMSWYKKAQEVDLELDDQEDLRAAMEEVYHDEREAFVRKVTQDARFIAYTAYDLPERLERGLIFKEVAELIYKSQVSEIHAASDIAALAKISYIMKGNYGSMIWILRNWDLPLLVTFFVLVKDQVVKDRATLEKASSLFDKWVLATPLPSKMSPQEVAEIIKDQMQ